MPALELIDWSSAAANGLWILGLALLLARAGWLAAAPRSARAAAPFAWLTPAGGLLFCCGLGFTAGSLIEKILWFGLGALLLANALFERRKARRSLPRPAGSKS